MTPNDLRGGGAPAQSEAGNNPTDETSASPSNPIESSRLDTASSQSDGIDRTRGGALRTARERKGLTVEDVATAVRAICPTLEIVPGMLTEIETGARPLRLTVASPLRRVLDARWEDIFVPTTFVPVTLLRESGREEGERNLLPARNTISDIERELRDFVLPRLALEMVVHWRDGREALDRWIERYCEKEGVDAFQQSLVRLLALVSLKKDHAGATTVADKLVSLAGDDPRRQLAAEYLRGRQRWYIKDTAVAIASLQNALELARELSDKVREAQCSYYLARITIDYPDRLADGPNDRINSAREIGRVLMREDLVLLADYAELMRLQKAKENVAAIQHSKAMLDRATEAGGSLGEELEHILDSVRINYGVCLRRTFTEEARKEAERYYEQGIGRTHDDSHAGICLYLSADLDVDRMLDAHRMATQLTGKQEEVAAQLEQARFHWRQALSRCEESQRRLEKTGDHAARQKVAGRLLFLRNMQLTDVGSSQEAVDTFALREQYFSHLFLGIPSPERAGAYDPANRPRFTTAEFGRLLSDYFGGLFLRTGSVHEGQTIDSDDYLRPGCVYCVPWVVGDTLVVRLFARQGGTSVMDNVGWFVIEHYVSQVRPLLGDVQNVDDAVFAEACRELFEELQQSVVTIDSLGDGRRFDHAILLAPRTNVDWLCPVEWLATLDPKTGKRCPTPLTSTMGAVVYATSHRPPFTAMELRVEPANFQVFASTQAIGADTIHRMVREALGRAVLPFEVSATSALESDSEGVVVIAHADEGGALVKLLTRSQFRGTRALILLFCSSGHYQMTSGPFVEGVALALRDRLAAAGPSIVVASRVPVDIDEALQFGKELLSSQRPDEAVADTVTRYIRNHPNAGPYSVPWVVLA